jgi:hypothetical protein
VAVLTARPNLPYLPLYDHNEHAIVSRGQHAG